ncbi:hypothetical protein PAECIP111892_01056 [Paenibacillus auburnensis]|uniref:PIN like domain-containing protein n=1 Tax=Paenibacillus auburnensis TaxID=2905649 RepID=A0ABM9BSZ0_9BACL|nr:hypothetical protein PAECIP111892_01056 [Paenibacillus auburnensis]
MRDTFSGYNTPTPEDFQKLWSNCLFVFDANTLINLYRFTKRSRDLMVSVMKKAEGKIWITHQVALEYHRNLLDEIHNQQYIMWKMNYIGVIRNN